jgi:hypothetical protein
MAAKIKMLKLLQEIRGFADLTNRRPQPRAPGLVLTQMRSHVIQATLPRRRLSVSTDKRDCPDISRPVKINHLKPGSDTTASVPAP